MIEIDGSKGEGGGQILRTSLALSMVTGQPVKIAKIRAGRKKPGLLRQHLTAVKAAAEISDAKLSGAELGAGTLTFSPKAIQAGDYHFAVGTAGSCTLVFQTVLPALMMANGSSTLELEGGTHNPFAPPFDFLQRAFLPQLERIGPKVELDLACPGFYPAGGGKFSATVQPSERFTGFELMERGKQDYREASAVLSRLATNIGERELREVTKKLDWTNHELKIREVTNSPGPGNVLMLMLVYEHVTEVFSGFGEKHLPASQVAHGVIRQVKEYLKREAPVGPYLADQLLIPLSLAGGGRFRCTRMTRHTATNIETVKTFLDIEIETEELEDQSHIVTIG